MYSNKNSLWYQSFHERSFLEQGITAVSISKGPAFAMNDSCNLGVFEACIPTINQGDGRGEPMQTNTWRVPNNVHNGEKKDKGLLEAALCLKRNDFMVKGVFCLVTGQGAWQTSYNNNKDLLILEVVYRKVFARGTLGSCHTEKQVETVLRLPRKAYAIIATHGCECFGGNCECGIGIIIAHGRFTSKEGLGQHRTPNRCECYGGNCECGIGIIIAMQYMEPRILKSGKNFFKTHSTDYQFKKLSQRMGCQLDCFSIVVKFVRRWTIIAVRSRTDGSALRLEATTNGHKLVGWCSPLCRSRCIHQDASK
eukprot:gene3287-5977_t